MKFDVQADADAAARRAAGLIEREARAAIGARGLFIMALSGGSTPRRMLAHLAEADLDWHRVRVAQVDERVAPPGDADRNLAMLQAALVAPARLAPEHLLAMPVEADMLTDAARDYARILERLAGAPSIIDLVQLGLGDDGHTASLVPGDPALETTDTDVTITGVYHGRQRMTLTWPAINRARRVLWLVTGEAKAPMLARLRDADAGIPAGRIRQDRATLIADRAAAGMALASE
jgi:6-phosphogluconolactonase